MSQRNPRERWTARRLPPWRDAQVRSPGPRTPVPLSLQSVHALLWETPGATHINQTGETSVLLSKLSCPVHRMHQKYCNKVCLAWKTGSRFTLLCWRTRWRIEFSTKSKYLYHLILRLCTWSKFSLLRLYFSPILTVRRLVGWGSSCLPLSSPRPSSLCTASS